MQSLEKFRTPPSNRTMGIEWEMLWEERHPRFRAVYLAGYLGFFYVTTDGSINVDNYNQTGRELVSQPLTAPWLLKELERVHKRIPTPLYNDSCGIHIHVSRKWATQKKVDHLSAFLTRLDLADYKLAFGRLPNYYSRAMSAPTPNCRYMALNTTNKNTVEFRMFRSGDLKWAQYCVKLINYMMVNANHLNTEAFFAFVEMEQPNDTN